jgi:flagellar biosynthetic protein FliP
MTLLRRTPIAALAAVVMVAVLWCLSGTAAAQSPSTPTPTTPTAPEFETPTASAGPSADGEEEDQSLDVTVDLNGGKDGEAPSQTVLIILGLTVLSVAPSLLILMTSFTRMIVVLSLVRNALGLQSIPPNQVLAGLALFLSLFVMAPTLTAINDEALQPYLDGDISQSEALQRAEGTIKGFMLANTRSSDLALMSSLRGDEPPEEITDTSLVVVVPAYVISELQSAFIIGIVVFVPFLVLDLVVSAALMSLGMMMLPPVFVSLPLKLLLFVMVGGWSLITESLVVNYNGVGFT